MARHHLNLREPKGAWDVHVNDEVVIELAENGTTGYTWEIHVEPHDAVLVEDSRFLPPVSDAAGAAGIRQVRLRVLRKGTSPLRFHLVCPFRPDDPPAIAGTIVLRVS